MFVSPSEHILLSSRSKVMCFRDAKLEDFFYINMKMQGEIEHAPSGASCFDNGNVSYVSVILCYVFCTRSLYLGVFITLKDPERV
jgi:hypothetical protein